VIFIEDFWLLPVSIPEAVTSVSETVLLVRRIGKYVLLFHDLDTRNTGQCSQHISLENKCIPYKM